MKKQLLSFAFLVAIAFTGFAQETPVDGLLPSRKTTAERTNLTNYPATTPAGTHVYDTDTQSLWYWDGTVWVENATAANSDFTDDAWINDALNTMVHLGTLSDGTTARPVGTEFVALDNGNVGIGTLTPTVQLEIDGGSLLLTDGYGRFEHPNNQVLVVDTQDPLRRTWSLNADNFLLGLRDVTANTTPFIIYGAAPTNSLRIAANGNIGIGIADPTSKLQVVDLPIFVDNAAAKLGADGTAATADDLTVGAFYHAGDGIVRVVF